MSKCEEMFEYKYVRIKLHDGRVFEGYTVSLNYGDETPEGEDMIGIETKNGEIVGLLESEIESWDIPAAYYGKRH